MIMKHLFTLLLCTWAMQCIGQHKTDSVKVTDTTMFAFSRTHYSWGGSTIPGLYSGDPRWHYSKNRDSMWIDTTHMDDTPYQYSPSMHFCAMPDSVWRQFFAVSGQGRLADSVQAAKIARYRKLRKAVEDIQSWQFIIRYCQRQIDSIKNSVQ